MYAFIALALLLADDDTPWLPPLSDLDHFPSIQVAAEQIDLYQQHLEWVEWSAEQPTLDGRFDKSYWCRMRQLTVDRLLTWGIPRRVHLERLQRRLGQHDYEHGTMPPALRPGDTPSGNNS